MPLRSDQAQARPAVARVMGNARPPQALAETSSLPGLREKLRGAEAAGTSRS